MIHVSADHPMNGIPSAGPSSLSFTSLLSTTHRVFTHDEFNRLLPDHCETRGFAPLVETERIALDFLIRGGKRFRPFVTLAAYQACVEGSHEPRTQGQPCLLNDAVKRTLIAIEVFHKASLVHDDIEDNDLYRYGRETLHRQYDTATAINVGDYLVGLGYRIITGDREVLGSDRAADILHRLMDAHVKLTEGQGAEIAWRRAADKALTPQDAMGIYARKTSPAFEAALYTGVRLAGPGRSVEKLLARYSRHLGIAFQILNDLSDWSGDADNKLIAKQDALSMRPTILLALALEKSDSSRRQRIEEMLAGSDSFSKEGPCLGDIFVGLDVFRDAAQLVIQHRRQAYEVATEVEHDGVRNLLYHLLEVVLPNDHVSYAAAS